MSENKHTLEPMFQYEYRLLATYEDGRTPVILTAEQYRRARACINACAGIPTSRLEAGAADILAYSMELKKQRDELLAALLESGQVACDMSPEKKLADDANASVKGQK